MAESGELPAHTCLVVESMSRLTRDEPYDGIGLIRSLWDLDFTIAFTQGNWKGEVLNGRGSGIHGRIESALEAASFEWVDKRARVVEHYDERAKRIENGDKSDNRSRSGTKAGKFPLWLDFNEEKNDFVKIPEKVKIVQRIFTMGETMGAKKIAYLLKQEGIKNISTNAKSEFTPPQTIRSILQNRAVLGEKRIREIIKYDYYPVIISPEQFTAVKDATKKRSTSENLSSNNKMINLFQGVIFCANCGGRIDVVKKNRDVCKIRGKKNGEKELVTYRQMYCHHGRARTTECTVTNPAPYIYMKVLV